MSTTTTTTFTAQWKHNGRWHTLQGLGTTPREAANKLRDNMERAGFRHSELQGHLDDLAAGHLLTAEDGQAFRVLGVKDTVVPTKKGREPLRAVRVPDELWAAAQERAATEQVSVSAVIRRCLELYAAGEPTPWPVGLEEKGE